MRSLCVVTLDEQTKPSSLSEVTLPPGADVGRVGGKGNETASSTACLEVDLTKTR